MLDSYGCLFRISICQVAIAFAKVPRRPAGKSQASQYFFLVDEWDEQCRENTLLPLPGVDLRGQFYTVVLPEHLHLFAGQDGTVCNMLSF